MPHTSGKCFTFEYCIHILHPLVTDGTMEGFLCWGHHERHMGHMAKLIASEMMGSDDEDSTTLQMKPPAKINSQAGQKPPTLWTFISLPIKEHFDDDNHTHIHSCSGSISSADNTIQEIPNEEVGQFRKFSYL